MKLHIPSIHTLQDLNHPNHLRVCQVCGPRHEVDIANSNPRMALYHNRIILIGT
jgi:hypothetical protein